MNKHSVPKRFHLIIDAFDCDVALLSDKIFLKKLIKSIAKLLDMRIIKGPVVVNGIPKNPGITAFAIIDFSHISIHTFTKSKEFCLDIFSCKPFSYKRMEKLVKKTFNLKGKQILKSIVKYN